MTAPAPGPVVLAVNTGIWNSSSTEFLGSDGGSGICVAGKLLATCRHVVQPAISNRDGRSFECHRILVTTETGARVSPVRVHSNRPDIDIAVLEFSEPIASRASLMALELDWEHPRLAAGRFAAKGFPGGARALERSQFREVPLVHSASRIQIPGGLQGGNSGGAIYLDDHPETPVVAMPAMGGGEAAVTSAISADQVVAFMVERGLWPDRLTFAVDFSGPGGRRALFGARRRKIAEFLGMPDVDVQSEHGIWFAILPPAVLMSPRDLPAAVEKPVGMMRTPVSRALAMWARDERGEPKDHHVMEADLTSDQMDSTISLLGERLGISVRLPTIEEWWLGVTAGSGLRTSTRTGAGGPGLSSFVGWRRNEWHIQEPPSGIREWVRGEGGRPVVIDRGGNIILPGRSSHDPASGFRLVCDDLRGGWHG